MTYFASLSHQGHTEKIWAVDLHPDGNLVCCGGDDKVCYYSVDTYFFDTPSFDSCLITFLSLVLCVVLTTNELFDFFFVQQVPRVWDVEGDEKDVIELKGHDDTIMVARFDPTNPDSFIFTTGYDCMKLDWRLR